MHFLTVEGFENPIPLNPAVSILNHLLKNQIPVRHDCGGKMQCGTCVVEILDGAGSLNPVKDAERLRLRKSGAGVSMRLACQTYAVRDVRIRIPRMEKNNPA